MEIEIEELQHPNVYNVTTLDGVGEFYAALGYSVIIPPGLDGLIVRLESTRHWPVLVFKLSEDADDLEGLSLYLKVSHTELIKIREMLHFTGSETLDPNGIQIKFYT